MSDSFLVTGGKRLSGEITAQGAKNEALASAKRVSALLFSKDTALLQSLTAEDWAMVANEIPAFSLSELPENTTIEVFLSKLTPILGSNSEARREIKANAVSINRQKATTHDQLITTKNALFGKYILVEVGKKNKYLVII